MARSNSPSSPRTLPVIVQTNDSQFHPRSTAGNANVNITKVADEFVAMTDNSDSGRLRPWTLDTLWRRCIRRFINTGNHDGTPHYDTSTHESFNYMLKLGRKSTYPVFGVPQDSKRRRTIGTADTARPSYMQLHDDRELHRFDGIPFRRQSEQHAPGGRPFIENYRWKPELGTTFHDCQPGRRIAKRFYRRPVVLHFITSMRSKNPARSSLDVSVYADAELCPTSS